MTPGQPWNSRRTDTVRTREVETTRLGPIKGGIRPVLITFAIPPWIENHSSVNGQHLPVVLGGLATVCYPQRGLAQVCRMSANRNAGRTVSIAVIWVPSGWTGAGSSRVNLSQGRNHVSISMELGETIMIIITADAGRLK
jgi:hypothetical protein